MPKAREEPAWLVISVGCPCGIGPEVSVAAAAREVGGIKLLVGDFEMLCEAAELVRVSRRKLVRFTGQAQDASKLYVVQAGPSLVARERRPGKPGKAAGAAQLAYVEKAYELAHGRRRAALVTAPVSKAAIAHSGLKRARDFHGHTEWLQALDGARTSVMCFASPRLVTSLVTTHLPLCDVPGALTTQGVSDATYWLGRLLLDLNVRRPRIAVASLNPHAGEDGMFGREETRIIVPAIARARRRLGPDVLVTGPLGAETAYRKAHAGGFD
ncbi:MAG TPA: 4-hydroxythreonine-4-phosphate dehydrogenase PdxA, partial [Polyangiaceae bacterium]|nr:4-hydroxythreonine-4-phosphate dehydrogenase PdxA [Polyangiaceae bacterium]